MKIAVYGPERSVAALVDSQVIDLDWAYAKYLRETQSVSRPEARADIAVPSNLQAFIEEDQAAIADPQSVEFETRVYTPQIGEQVSRLA